MTLAQTLVETRTCVGHANIRYMHMYVHTLFRYPPMSAPKMVDGSMTSMRSQSINGLGLKEWRRPMLKKRLARAPPTMVKLDSATAYLAGKPATKDTSDLP